MLRCALHAETMPAREPPRSHDNHLGRVRAARAGEQPRYLLHGAPQPPPMSENHRFERVENCMHKMPLLSRFYTRVSAGQRKPKIEIRTPSKTGRSKR